jgi:Tti2 family
MNEANRLKTLETFYILEACIRNLRYSPEIDNAAIHSLYQRISTTILPGTDLVTHSETTQGRQYQALPVNLTRVTGTLETPPQELKRFIVISSLGTSVLKYLDELLPLSDYQDHIGVFISLAAFTDIKDPWASETSFTNATYLLTKNHSLITKPYVLVNHTLQGLIRPLFAKSKHPEITAQGRRALQPSPRVQYPSLLEEEAKPWRFSKIYCVTVFRWALQNLEVRLPSSYT